MRQAARVLLAVVVAGALALAGACAPPPGGGSGGSAGSTSVTIQGFLYHPAAIEVKTGATVTWTNKDPTQHTVTADDGTFDSGVMQPGGTYSFTFARPGTYAYYCAVHPGMAGQVVVR